jgi:hypothetical protein
MTRCPTDRDAPLHPRCNYKRTVAPATHDQREEEGRGSTASIALRPKATARPRIPLTNCGSPVHIAAAIARSVITPCKQTKPSKPQKSLPIKALATATPLSTLAHRVLCTGLWRNSAPPRPARVRIAERLQLIPPRPYPRTAPLSSLTAGPPAPSATPRPSAANLCRPHRRRTPRAGERTLPRRTPALHRHPPRTHLQLPHQERGFGKRDRSGREPRPGPVPEAPEGAGPSATRCPPGLRQRERIGI